MVLKAPSLPQAIKVPTDSLAEPYQGERGCLAAPERRDQQRPFLAPASTLMLLGGACELSLACPPDGVKMQAEGRKCEFTTSTNDPKRSNASSCATG